MHFFQSRESYFIKIANVSYCLIFKIFLSMLCEDMILKGS